MAIYLYPIPANGISAGFLYADLLAAGFPIAEGGVAGPTSTFQVRVTTTRDLTPAEQTQVGVIVAAHDARPRQPRTIFAIRQQLNTLTNGQKTAIWTNLSAGTPPLWALDAGPNAAAIAAIEWGATVPAGVTAAEKTEARLRLAAMYVQDNPRYLVNPAFDPTINVAGDEPAV